MPAVKQVPELVERNGAPHGNIPDIIDIRQDRADLDLKNEVITQLSLEQGQRKLPTLLLYDKKGLQLFEHITYLDEYYLTNHEISILEAHARDMAAKVPSGAVVVELGSGNLRKVLLLLQAFEDAAKRVDYYALDLSRDELERTLAHLPDFNYVTCRGLWGTYGDGREWLRASGDRPKSILHMGSSIGNFHRDEAADFLAMFADIMQPQDTMFIGVDSCIQPDKVYHAYNDSEGVTHQFILNGLTHANTIFGKEIFHLPDWKVIGEYVYDDEGGRHQAFVTPLRDVVVLGHQIKQFERIKIEQSLKYSPMGSEKLWKLAGLEEVDRWSEGDEYGIHQLRRSKMPFPLDPSRYAPSTVPTTDEWRSLWAAWDTVTRRMLPDQELTEKPIKLRNACIFYLGHIPAFLDIQLNKSTRDPPTDPAYYYDIFERGIDPDVDDPEKCHDHSEIPDDWPHVDDILAYQNRVRSRLTALYGPRNDPSSIPRHVARTIWLGFEHEAMHLETLLYMMLQSPKTLAPPHTVRPDFEKMAHDARAARVPNQWFDIPAQTVKVGLDDPEDGSDSTVHFGWDNEKPSRRIKVHSFQAKGRPITNEEYAQYMESTGITQIPASWTTIDSKGSASFLDDKAVRTVYGPVPLGLALDWPVFASYDELSACAAWMGGRIPTYEEARSIYAHADVLRGKKMMLLESKLGATVPAVNGHLVNNGVQETPPPSSLFADLAGENVGLRHWHPTPVTHRGGSLAGQSGMGGLWEWTSSPLLPHEGFEPTPLYPGYTADFFDGKHNVVLGGSWATHPRIAGRRSFVNWYQKKYPYAWVGARLVRDSPLSE